MLAEEILSPLSVTQDRRIADLTSIFRMMCEVFVHFALCSLNRLANRLSATIFLLYHLEHAGNFYPNTTGFQPATES